MTPVSHAGKLRFYISKWQLITQDPNILSWLEGYKLPFYKPVCQSVLPSLQKLNSLEISKYEKAVDGLLAVGAISPCQYRCDQFTSSTFLIPKPDGTSRFILNLKSLNKFIKTSHFKIEDLRTTLKLVSKNCYVATIDLKDAYFLINIDEHYRKYLRFKVPENSKYKSSFFEFRCLPFGLNTGPYLFTKLMKPVMALLRSLGYISTIYLDDICCIGHTYKDCLDNVTKTRQVLEALGFVINENKSQLTPSTTCKYLGFIINTEKFHIELTKEKRTKIQDEIKKISHLDRCKIRHFAQFVGLLTSACPGIEYGWLYTKVFERCKYLALLNTDDYEEYMSLPTYIQEDLSWWLNSVNHSVCPIREEKYCMEIFSDASKTGWGAACGQETACGQWSQIEKDFHINQLEILAAFFGLKIFGKDMRNCQIVLRIDNTTAIAYINRMGGVRFPHLNMVTRELWQWCEQRHIHVFASYISSKDNETADAESRRVHPDIEWELSKEAFEKLVNMFGMPEIDLFASRINKKCQKYVSWQRDPDAYAVNAFTIDWKNLYFYAFPPFAMILKALRKIISDEAEGIVIVPYWPTQPWFPIFESLLVSETLLFDPNHNALLTLSHSHHHPPPRVTLAAGKLSARHF